MDIKQMVEDSKQQYAEKLSQIEPNQDSVDEVPVGAEPPKGTESQEDKTNSSLHTEEQPQEEATTPEDSEQSNQETDASSQTETEESQEQSSEYSGEVKNNEVEQEDTGSEEEYLSPEQFTDYVYSEIEGDEELRNSLLEKLGVTSNEFASPEIEKVNQWVKETGRSIDDYYFVNNTLNTESMDNATAIKAQMRLDNPELSADEINVLFDDRYPSDEDEHDQAILRKSEILLKSDGAKAKRELNSLKEKYSAPKPKQESPEQKSLLPENFNQQYSENMSTIEGFEFDLGNGKTFSYDFKNGEAEALAKRGYDTSNPLSYWMVNGQLDLNQMTEDIAFLANSENVVKAAFTQGGNLAREENVKSKKNIDLPQSQTPPPPVNSGDAKMKEQVDNVMNRLGFG